MRFSRAKPTGSFRVFQPSTRAVASHNKTLQDARKSAAYWTSAVGSSMEIQERFPSGAWVTVETARPKSSTPKRAHATTRDLSAVEDALGYTPEPGVVRRAEAAYSDYSTNELRREIQSLEDQFEMSGGRGVGLADRLDAARIALALRSSKGKRSHATKLSDPSPRILKISRPKTFAAQRSITADVQYPGEPPSRVEFVGPSASIGGPGPVVMITRPSGHQVFVTDPSRFGDFGPDWVRRFFQSA